MVDVPFSINIHIRCPDCEHQTELCNVVVRQIYTDAVEISDLSSRAVISLCGHARNVYLCNGGFLVLSSGEVLLDG